MEGNKTKAYTQKLWTYLFGLNIYLHDAHGETISEVTFLKEKFYAWLENENSEIADPAILKARPFKFLQAFQRTIVRLFQPMITQN